MLENLIDENGNEISLIPPSRKYTCTKSESWTRVHVQVVIIGRLPREKKRNKKERATRNLTVMASRISHG